MRIHLLGVQVSRGATAAPVGMMPPGTAMRMNGMQPPTTAMRMPGGMAQPGAMMQMPGTAMRMGGCQANLPIVTPLGDDAALKATQAFF